MACVSLLLACSGAAPAPTQQPVSVRSDVSAPREPLCEFEGQWWGRLRFDGADVTVISMTADARLFESGLEAHVSGDGWHLYGHTVLSEDHVLRMWQDTWLSEGVAVESGSYVAVNEATTGSVLVSPEPSAVEHIRFAEDPGGWLECGALTLEEDPEGIEPLELPEASEWSYMSAPFSLSHTPSGPPFADVLRDEFEQARSSLTVVVGILERRGSSARIRVLRHGEESTVVLVGWVDAVLLGPNGGQDGVLYMFGADNRDLEREECHASEELPLYIVGALGRVRAGRLDAGTTFRVDERDGDWALVGPIDDVHEELLFLSVPRFVVPSADLQCTTHRGTRVRKTFRTEVSATGLACGAACECELRLTRPHEDQGTCHVWLECGDQIVLGEHRAHGEFDCAVQGGRAAGADLDGSTDAWRGDPRFSIDGDTFTASDEAVGRLGAFRLEGRILR